MLGDGLGWAGCRANPELAVGHDCIAATAAAGMLRHAVGAAGGQLVDQRRDGVRRGHQHLHTSELLHRPRRDRSGTIERHQQAAAAEDVATAQRRRLPGDRLLAEQAIRFSLGLVT